MLRKLSGAAYGYYVALFLLYRRNCSVKAVRQQTESQPYCRFMAFVNKPGLYVKAKNGKRGRNRYDERRTG